MAKTRIIELSLVIANKRTGFTCCDISRVVAITATPTKIHSLVEKFTTSGRDLFTALGTYSGPDQMLLTVEAKDHISREVLSHIITVF
jgi:hypothetical protein